MGVMIIVVFYFLLALLAYSLLYYLCARRYSKDEYVKRKYKFEEYMDEHHMMIIMFSVIWIFTLLAFIVYSLTFIIRKGIEKYFNIED